MTLEVEIIEEDDKVIRIQFPGSNAQAGSALDIVYQDEFVQLVRLNCWFGPWFWQPYFLLPA
ncbi:hypothetical protein [Tautonia plasticadhaerens]|uniref:Uncharacterized protein n=1 Tax=Tautonia plasticadhaerens TaxID=2527974 RepID=A0A518H284_9BACT|nr:hypothetical protein [Tautonia plasticadhaerens]QDV34920.1 hypothetical protein ElP_28170 [Tautonia plasticadhaerens]